MFQDTTADGVWSRWMAGWRDVIIVDAQTLFRDTNVSTNTEDTLSGCMSIKDDADCNALFENMGLNLETGEPESVANFFRVGP